MITRPADVRPAVAGPLSRYPGFEDVARWVRGSVAHLVKLVPVYRARHGASMSEAMLR
jgi:hypothetical protein